MCKYVLSWSFYKKETLFNVEDILTAETRNPLLAEKKPHSVAWSARLRNSSKTKTHCKMATSLVFEEVLCSKGNWIWATTLATILIRNQKPDQPLSHLKELRILVRKLEVIFGKAAPYQQYLLRAYSLVKDSG